MGWLSGEPDKSSATPKTATPKAGTKKPGKKPAKKDAIDEILDSLGITEESAAAQREEASVGCQHVNMKSDGMSTWCEDCGLMDDA